MECGCGHWKSLIKFSAANCVNNRWTKVVLSHYRNFPMLSQRRNFFGWDEVMCQSDHALLPSQQDQEWLQLCNKASYRWKKIIWYITAGQALCSHLDEKEKWHNLTLNPFFPFPPNWTFFSKRKRRFSKGKGCTLIPIFPSEKALQVLVLFHNTKPETTAAWKKWVCIARYQCLF